MKPFDALGLTEDASPTEVKAAYKDLARKIHPDAGGSTEKFQELSRCYKEALRISEEPKHCVSCMGTGYVLEGCGFAMMSIVCKECSGRGKK